MDTMLYFTSQAAQCSGYHLNVPDRGRASTPADADLCVVRFHQIRTVNIPARVNDAGYLPDVPVVPRNVFANLSGIYNYNFRQPADLANFSEEFQVRPQTV